MAGNIFINYRRGDDPGFTQALFSRLEQAFETERLFIDVDNIAPGLDFVQVLNDQVARCDVLIAVIGKDWLSSADESGARRLDNPEDFVRIEIESALEQKKRVIPVLVNDARMPRSTELPETLRAFARCNAVRLTHERFRADTQGLIKALEQVLAEADAARLADEDAARREVRAREKEEAERLKQERFDQVRKRRDTESDLANEQTEPKIRSRGLVSWIAGLPPEISWRVPIGVVLVYVLGWLVPGLIFMTTNLGWGRASLFYGLAGLLAVAVATYLRRNVLGGAELAVYWFAAVSFFGVAALSIITLLGFGGVINSDAYLLVPTLITLAILLALRRPQIGGLEASVYFVGAAMVAFWAVLPLLASTTAMAELDASLTGGNGYRTAGFVLAALLALVAMVMLVWRRSKASGPEFAVYGLGSAYLLATALLEYSGCSVAAC